MGCVSAPTRCTTSPPSDPSSFTSVCFILGDRTAYHCCNPFPSSAHIPNKYSWNTQKELVLQCFDARAGACGAGGGPEAAGAYGHLRGTAPRCQPLRQAVRRRRALCYVRTTQFSPDPASFLILPCGRVNYGHRRRRNGKFPPDATTPVRNSNLFADGTQICSLSLVYL